MRVLWATHQLPHRSRGGGWTHAYELLRHAANRHRITLLSGGVEPGATDEAVTALEDLDIDVVPVHWVSRRVRTRVELLRRAALGAGTVGFWEVAPCASALAAEVVARESKERFDLVHVWTGEMARVAAGTEAPSALYLADSYTVQLERERHHATSWRRQCLAALEARAARRWERRHYPNASALACVSEKEASVLTELTGRSLDVVPVALADDWFAPPDRPRQDLLVTFVAALDYRPNVDAVRWLLTEVWPRVSAQQPRARLAVVGRDPVSEVLEMLARADPTVQFHPDVPDVRPYLWQTAVALFPLRLGSGVKNKVLHAAACRAPMVGTPVAVEGIEGLVRGRQALVADRPAALADAVIATLADPAGAASRVAAAHELAQAYRSPAAAEALDRLWRRTAELPRRNRSAYKSKAR